MALDIQSFGLGGANTNTSIAYCGGKGSGLIKMSEVGIPVPPGFILPTTVWAAHKADPEGTLVQIRDEIKPWLSALKEQFGYMPLLSIRSGARVSCPGMMDTILNVGLDQSTIKDWRKRVGSDCANDSYRRLIEMYGSVVNNLDREAFHKKGYSAALTLYAKQVGSAFPEADAQIIGSILAVFQSWDNPRAQVYRKMHDIPEDWGTGVVLQAMVFGNYNENSCTGVMFSRNPDTGDAAVVGEYLNNAQGEDVVAGTATPKSLKHMKLLNPKLYAQLIALADKLEKLNRDVQDIEFTVQDGKLYALQTRNAKRSAVAAVGIALALVKEGLITKQEAYSRVSVRTLDLASQKILDPKFKDAPLYTGIPACSGIATGIVVKSSAIAANYKGKCILVSKETTPDDIAGMAAAEGVLTMTGGATSHAAVVARGMNRVCVVGLGADIEAFKAGTIISIDGATGRVWEGAVPVTDGSSSPALKEFRAMLRKDASTGQALQVGDEISGNIYIALSELQEKPVAAVIKMLDAAAAKADMMIVDFAKPAREAEAEFMNCFAGYFEAWYTILASHLDSKQYKNVYAMNYPLNSATMQRVENGESLEALVACNGLISLPTWDKPPAAHAKVMKWREKDGDPIKIVSVGKVLPLATHVYLSEGQAAHELLSKV